MSNTVTVYPNTDAVEGALYAGPVGMQLLTLAHKYHSQIALNTQSDKDPEFNLNIYSGPHLVPHGCSYETALIDKYANYHCVGVLTEPYHGVGYTTDEYG